MKALVFVVAYSSDADIESVLRRIPEKVWREQCDKMEVLIIDDPSTNRTAEPSERFRDIDRKHNLVILSNLVDQGYGGNQKLGFHYAIRNNFDVVVLMHGNGQYAPELLPNFISIFEDPSADAVLGSRLMDSRWAVPGGMPLYKFVGNRILTTLQNWILKQRLSEFHSGYRAYRVDSREIRRLNGLNYAAQILATTIRSRLQRWAIFYHPKFDYVSDNRHYTLKLRQPSSHQWALDHCAKDVGAVLDLGCGPGALDQLLREQGCYTMGVDKTEQDATSLDWFRQADLDDGLFDLSILRGNPTWCFVSTLSSISSRRNDFFSSCANDWAPYRNRRR
jgi:Glycosyl transferase family 2